MIKVNFYCVYENDIPIYIGITTRSIDKRHGEHIKEKSLDNTTIKLIHSVDYFDTDLEKSAHWNMCRFSDIINKEEERLIKEYNTINSPHQKQKDGGAVLAWFKFKTKISSVKNIIDYQKNKTKISRFFTNIDNPKKIKLRNFFCNIDNPKRIKLISFFSGIKNPKIIKLRIFFNHINNPKKIKLRCFFANIDNPQRIKLINFFCNIDNPKKIKIRNFFNIINNPKKIKLKNFFCNIDNPQKIKIRIFFANMCRARRFMTSPC